MATLELALPVKVAVLQQMQEQGRTIRTHQCGEPDDLQLARQQIEGLLQQIQPEPYKLYVAPTREKINGVSTYGRRRQSIDSGI
jgi:hypothetical protein